MKSHVIIARLSVLLLMTGVAPAFAQTPVVESARKLEDSATIVAKMLRGGLEFDWLFKKSIISRVEPLPEHRAEADTMVGLAQVARKGGLATRPDVAAALRGAETMILANAMRRSLIDSINPSDEEVAARIAAQAGRYDEYRLSHILVKVGALPSGKVRTDVEALAIVRTLRARISAGADFAMVAREASDDATSAADGGGLPVMRGPSMKDIFLPYVRSLARDATTDAIRSDEGYHLVHLDQRIVATPDNARYWVTEDMVAERLPRLIDDAIAQVGSAKSALGE